VRQRGKETYKLELTNKNYNYYKLLESHRKDISHIVVFGSYEMPNLIKKNRTGAVSSSTKTREEKTTHSSKIQAKILSQNH
jgi:hypothetical protein